jgi:hypothetical protein
VKTAPRSGWGAAQILPWWALATDRQMVNPNPSPWILVVMKG